MNKKIILPIVVIVLAGGVLWWYATKRSAEEPVDTTPEQQTTKPLPPATNPQQVPETEQPQVQTPTPKTNGSGGTFSGEGEVTAPDISVFEVTYDGENFSPASLTVKAGDVVFFKNDSSGSFRPASDPHPSHTDYPGFDSKNPVAAGSRFEFKFTKVGTWGYHNHLNPSSKGTVIVTN